MTIMNYLKKKKKLLLLLIIFVLGFYLFSLVGDIIRHGYDKQNKVIELTKSIISPHYIKKIKNILFIIPQLKAKNQLLELQIKKYEQGNDGQKFKKQFLELGDSKYELNFYFLPFKRLDVNQGWNAKENSLRAHYAEIKNEKIFVISGEGKIVYFEKKNFLKDKLEFKDLPNNIKDILNENDLKLIGIRDLYFHNNEVYISMIIEDQKGITINIYKADLNLNKINFEIMFQTKEYWKKYNVFSGGRIERFDDENILFATGYAGIEKIAQDTKSLLGKIIKISVVNGDHEIISIGHRNPQGLKYIKNKNLIINSEHGPKGGDEINFNILNKGKKIKNYGWDIASYGTNYDGTDPFKKSHSNFGFEEPTHYYVPSIGISEIILLKENSFCRSKCLMISSLRANSIYLMNINDKFDELIPNERIFLKGNRIRDIDYDEEFELVILLTENVPAIVTMKKIKKID